jgi:hypothetical protein
VSLVIFASIINIIFITLAKRNDAQARSSRPLLFRTAYLSTFGAQIAVLLIMYFVISEMLIFHSYDKIFLLLVIVVSHFLSVFILGMLSVIFLQWFRFGRSLSILIYALVFIVILFVILTTLPLLVVTHSMQSQSPLSGPAYLKKDDVARLPCVDVTNWDRRINDDDKISIVLIPCRLLYNLCFASAETRYPEACI